MLDKGICVQMISADALAAYAKSSCGYDIGQECLVLCYLLDTMMVFIIIIITSFVYPAVRV